MTDRFKFRAWDKGLKQMVYPDIIYHNINLGCTVYRAFKPSDGDLYFPIQENLIVIQCTGLKDIEGKLIYEGDILRWVSYEGFEIGDIKGIYVVKWNDEGFYELHDPFSDEYWPINDTEFDNIVGNIYEHIHLLPDYESNT